MNPDYEGYLKGEQKSEHTIRAYIKDVNDCLAFINKPDNEITRADLSKWKTSIAYKSSATVARAVASVKNYFQYLYEELEVISIDPTDKMKKVKVVNKEKRALTPEQIRAMIDVCSSIRSKAIIMLLASTGLRISELINLTVEEYHHNSLIIFGKGRKYRTVYLSDETREAVDEYLAIRDSDLPNLFISNGGHPMQANNISLMLKNTACKAGVKDWNKISNHWLRTAAATMQSEAGQPIEVIQEMLGHSQIETTKRYVKVSQKRVEAAMSVQLF